MNLVLDIGNTIKKFGVFQDEALLHSSLFENARDLISIFDKYTIKNILVASVGDNFNLELPEGIKILSFNKDIKLPFKNNYHSPTTLGQDRIAGVAGAMTIFPGKNCLVIDAGTCITYDLVDQNERYFGGGISPGISMRFKALHNFTSRLPLITMKSDVPLIGQTTEESIQSGVQNGILAEVRQTILNYRQLYPNLNVVMTGGDLHFFENNIKETIFAVPHLLLVGLNMILKHNV